MKSFKFSLERMSNYKEQLLESEKNKLKNLRTARDEIEQKIINLKKMQRVRELDFFKREAVGVNSTELYTYNFYCEHHRKMLKELDIALLMANEAVERQLSVVITATQEVSGLEKLKDKEYAEHSYLETKEKQLEILEYVSTQITQKQQQA